MLFFAPTSKTVRPQSEIYEENRALIAKIEGVLSRHLQANDSKEIPDKVFNKMDTTQHPSWVIIEHQLNLIFSGLQALAQKKLLNTNNYLALVDRAQTMPLTQNPIILKAQTKTIITEILPFADQEITLSSSERARTPAPLPTSTRFLRGSGSVSAPARLSDTHSHPTDKDPAPQSVHEKAKRFGA